MSVSSPLLLLLIVPVFAGTIAAWRGRRHGLGSRRRALSLAIRLLIFAALILALAGLTWQRPSGAQAVVFVGDLSASTSSGQGGMVRFIDQALHRRGRDDRAALVAVGRAALVEQPPAPLSAFGGFSSVVDPAFTDLESGLSLGAALLPAGYRRRVVLVTDGRQNLGDAVSEARLLQAEGVRVDVAPVAVTPGADVRVDGVDVPGSLHIGEHFTITVRLFSSVATDASVQIFEDSQLITSASAGIPIGSSVLSYPAVAHSAGVHTYRAVIQPVVDAIAKNNEGSAFATVSGPPRVLVVEGAPGFGINVAASLRAGKITADTVGAPQMPQDLAGLQRYAAVVLVDAPADLIGAAAMQALRSYVSDLGRGLVALGGPNSYGVGGYGGTPLEEALPVRMELPKRKDLPTAAVVLIIESLESDAGVNISKQAGRGVIGLLTPEDQVAVSDGDNGFVVPLQRVADRARIAGAIDAMSPLDPMSYTQALTDAYNALRKAKAQTKHIILLGDGDATDSYRALVTRIARAGIQVSTIETNAAVATDFQTMRDIARWGNGHYYPADNPATIPQVFLKVARTVAHTSIVEGRFFPSEYAPSPILSGIVAAPALDGYVVTTPRALSTVVLASPKSDPILSQWQYGLGRAVAWTSDSQGRWSSGWLASGATRGIWAQMVNWVLPPPQSTSLSLTTSATGGLATLGVDTTAGDAYRGISARVVGPDDLPQTVTLQATTPNHYEAQVQTGHEGAYLIDVQAAVRGSKAVRTISGGLVVPYAPDYRDTGVDPVALQAIAAAGGGSVLSRPAQAFAGNVPPVDAPLPLQTPLLLLALLLLPVDVGIRRLVIGREDWQALLSRLPGYRRPAAGTVPQVSASLAGLRASRASRQGLRGAMPGGAAQAGSTSGVPAVTGSARVAPVPDGSLPDPRPAAGVVHPGSPAAVARRDSLVPPSPSPVPGPATVVRGAGGAPAPEGRPVPAVPESQSGSATSKLLDARRRRRPR